MTDPNAPVEKIWLRDYPPDVPAEIDPDSIPSLKHLYEHAFRKHAACLHERRKVLGEPLPYCGPGVAQMLQPGTKLTALDVLGAHLATAEFAEFVRSKYFRNSCVQLCRFRPVPKRSVNAEGTLVEPEKRFVQRD